MSTHSLIVESPTVGSVELLQVVPFLLRAPAFWSSATATKTPLPNATAFQFLAAGKVLRVQSTPFVLLAACVDAVLSATNFPSPAARHFQLPELGRTASDQLSALELYITVSLSDVVATNTPLVPIPE